MWTSTRRSDRLLDRLWLVGTRGSLLLAVGLIAVVQTTPEDVARAARWLRTRRVRTVRQAAVGASWAGPWDVRFAERTLRATASAGIEFEDHLVVGQDGRASVRRERPDLPWAKRPRPSTVRPGRRS